jgi:lipoprotein-releasing system permease protein
MAIRNPGTTRHRGSGLPGAPHHPSLVRIKRRSFSLLLARRYLNPRRSMLSSFSLISLIGVMLGVLVLVAVMAVYAGLERQVKDRILGFTPHILLSPPATLTGDPGDTDWRAAAKRAATLPRVEAATAYVSDNVIIDHAGGQRPVMFQSVDTTDPEQITGVDRMLDHANHPDSSADFGLDDRVVVSSILAWQLGLRVGEPVRLYSTRNFQEVLQAYKATEKPVLREAFAESWQQATSTLAKAWQRIDQRHAVPIATLREVHGVLDALRGETLRGPEAELLDELVAGLEAGDKDETKNVYLFDSDTRSSIETSIQSLATTDQDALDADILKSLKQIVLPKEVLVIGIYQASQMAITPDLFLPLHLAQQLAGLGDSVQGIALRLDDPYAAPIVAAEARRNLGPDWPLLTWAEQNEKFFSLINQQRVMMYFVLSFIVLVSAFSMMAVMFTVTIQKRREIGVMKALGAAPGQIVRVFLIQGMILGALGACSGVALGRLVIHFRGELQGLLRTAGFDPFSSAFVGFDVLPAHNNPAEQVVIGLSAFLLCSLAAMVPAFFAARSDAAKSLRNL